MFGLVGRAALDQANAELGRVYDMLRCERDRVTALTQEIVNLRRDGFMKPAPAQTVPDTPRAVGEPIGEGIDEVIERYAEMHPTPAAARRQLQKFAARLGASGKTPEEIITAIHRGDPTTGDDDE
jgi:hypothetical protein